MFVLYIIVYAQSKYIFGPKVVHLSPSLQREPRNQPYIRLIQLKSIKYITYIFKIALGRKLAFFGRSEKPGRPYFMSEKIRTLCPKVVRTFLFRRSPDLQGNRGACISRSRHVRRGTPANHCRNARHDDKAF